MSIKKFKEENPFEKRIQDSKKLLIKYPDRVPIICGLSESEIINFPEYNKTKYLVPRDLTMGQFLHVVRSKTNLNKSQGLFIFTEKNTFCCMSKYISVIYDEFKSEDGFLYLILAKENTFGN